MAEAGAAGGAAQRLRAVGERAVEVAARRGANSVEAEHVLLAIVEGPGSAASRALDAAGLGVDALTHALALERARSLGVVGIEQVDAPLLEATPRATRPPWGASVRELLGNADKRAAKAPGMLEVELVASILRAELGTVPRALAIVGIDRSALLESLTRH